MCGRYFRRSDKQRIAEAFRLGKLPPGFVLSPDFNIAPSTFQPVIRLSRDTGLREIVLMRWGLVPFFTGALKDVKGLSTINARSETVATSGSFREPFRKRRCLVPVDGFYEWKKPTKSAKQPFAFTLRGGGPFAFAGIWDAWKEPKSSPQETDRWLQSFSILTTDANELMATVHTRMPVILHPRDYDRWLQRGEADPAQLQQLLAMLRPYEAEAMTAAPANPSVGNVRNNGPEMLDPIDARTDPNEPTGSNSK